MSVYVALSSVGVSPGLPCSALARTTMVQLSIPSSAATGDVTIQCTLDNLALYPTPVWSNISTSHYTLPIGPDSITVTLLSPVAGLRISSSANNFTAGTSAAQLRCLQQSESVG